MIITLLVGTLTLTACSVRESVVTSQHGGTTTVVAPQSGRSVWHVGSFTVREVRLPAAAAADTYPNYGPYALSGGYTLATVTTHPPYAVSRENLATGKWTQLGTVTCAQRPFFALSYGPGAVLFCPGRQGSADNRFVVIGPSGPMTTVGAPFHTVTPASRLMVGTTQMDGYLEWSVWSNTEPAITYGDGFIDLATGRNGPVPEAVTNFPGRLTDGSSGPGTVTGYTVISSDDALYDYVGPEGGTTDTLYRLSTSTWAWSKIGTMAPGAYPWGEPSIASDGSWWWVRPSQPKWGVVTHLNARSTEWLFKGDLLGAGPGFFAYMPAGQLTTLILDFPEAGKTLEFTDLGSLPGPPYYLNDAAQLGTGGSKLTNTQVIYLGTTHGERTLIITP